MLKMSHNHTGCLVIHPLHGQCTKGISHDAETNDVHTRQHEAGNGVKWPHLAVLDPKEGFNGPFPYRM